MSSHSSHHRHTSTHPYHVEPQQSMSTLASSTGETKKTFLGRWKSVFKKEAMEVLPEQDSPISSSLQRSRITHLQALPPHPERTPPSAAELARYLLRLGLGTAGPNHSPATEQPSGSRPRNGPVFPTTGGPHDIFVSSTSELDLVWDNLNLPYTAFIIPRENPYRRGTTEYPSVIHWEEPVRITT